MSDLIQVPTTKVRREKNGAVWCICIRLFCVGKYSFLLSPKCRHHFRIPDEGVLACLDGYMNIAMEQTEEYVDGQLKAKYGDCFIRGNNVLYISAARK